jgi:hypothetical protein
MSQTKRIVALQSAQHVSVLQRRFQLTQRGLFLLGDPEAQAAFAI